MFVFKNAWKSIIRTKGRNILIGIIVVAVAASSCIALSIRNSASSLVESYKSSLDITATLGVDREKMRSNASSSSTEPSEIMSSIPEITIDNINDYGDSKYVSSYYYSSSISLNSSNIEVVSDDSSSTSTDIGRGNAPQMESGDFSLVGYSSLSAMTNFIEGTYKITDGSIFDETDTSNVCVITDELADANDLTVGSTITLTNPEDETQTFNFKVVGIYTDTTTDSSDTMSFFSPGANQIITNYTAVANIIESSSSDSDTAITGRLNSTFNLTSSDVIDKFTAEVEDKGLNEYYTVSTNLDTVSSTIAPITNLKTFATTFLILVLAIGGVILFILNMINIRERKYEIGVLRTIGMKKKLVLSQFVVELFIVTFIGIIIGTGIGSALSVPTASSLLAKEIAAQETTQSEIGNNFGKPGLDMSSSNTSLGKNTDYIDEIDASVNGTVLLQITLIGLLLTIFSSSVSMIYISRYTPLKILSERT